jgi:Holliday junction DNA helicase RuvA
MLLTQVQSIGPKVALAVLSGGTPRELINAIAAGDSARFQAVPGIGKRTAERIIVELREKVGAADVDEPGLTMDANPPARDARDDAREGLLGLGYSAAEVEALLADATGDSAEELIASALRGARQ